MSFLGIDLGTSGLRALLVDDHGVPVGSAEGSCDVSHPFDGWSEQDPAQWINALYIAVEALRKAHPEFASLKGIGIAGHMHGATLLDERGEVLRPCILWNDIRASEEAAVLDATMNVRDLSANIVFPGFTSPKLRWVQTYEPEVFARTAKAVLPAGYLNFYLTGAYVADMSDSAGTSWLNVAERCWSEDLLRAGHMSLAQMPDLVEGSEVAGHLRRDLRARWGLSEDVVVCGGAGDNAAAACGIGALGEGQGFVSLGTSGVVLLARDQFAPAPETAVHTFCHAVPDKWYQMGVMLSATDSLNWLSRITARSPADLTAALGETLRAPTDTRFLPYLSGERTPHNDGDIRGAFTGLSARTTRADMTQAVIEGVSFGLRNSLDALRQAGAAPERLIVIGGGSASPYWLKVLATVLNLPLDLPTGSEFGAALGAARLAQIAATGCDPSDVITAPDIAQTTLPDPDLLPAFETGYAAFCAAYPVIKRVQ